MARRKRMTCPSCRKSFLRDSDSPSIWCEECTERITSRRDREIARLQEIGCSEGFIQRRLRGEI